MSLGNKIECHLTREMVRSIGHEISKWGGVLLLGEDRENLCRRVLDEEVEQFDPAKWVIEAQGLPNLIHEWVHALFLGRLADDHGFDYGEIPLDLELRAHRQHLWEELACCALSTSTCAPLHAEPETFARAWFVEQFEIQGVFHGLEHDLDGFRRRIDAQLAQAPRRAELEGVIRAAHGALQTSLRQQMPDYVLPDCQIMLLWHDYRDYAGLGSRNEGP